MNNAHIKTNPINGRPTFEEPVANCDRLTIPIEHRILTFRGRQVMVDVARHNAQYPGVTLHKYTKAHDRFLVIDETVYHIGHSLKDLGKKLFAFSKMDVITGTELLSSILI